MADLRIVSEGPTTRQADLPPSDRDQILAKHPDRGHREPTESDQVLLEDLLIAIRRLRAAGFPCLPSATAIALDGIDYTVCRCLELKA